MLIWSSGRCWGVDVDNAVAGNIVFPAGVFTHSPLRRHLTAQQQDKADEERDANYRRRSQRREILQQGVLLPCRLRHRRISPSPLRYATAHVLDASAQNARTALLTS